MADFLASRQGSGLTGNGHRPVGRPRTHPVKPPITFAKIRKTAPSVGFQTGEQLRNQNRSALLALLKAHPEMAVSVIKQKRAATRLMIGGQRSYADAMAEIYDNRKWENE